jgi:hypothetical protein
MNIETSWLCQFLYWQKSITKKHKKHIGDNGFSSGPAGEEL